jgi:hypothetical protein
MSKPRHCKAWLCRPLNVAPEVKPGEFAWMVAEIKVHHESCPFWSPPQPEPGERLEFGVHRQLVADAETAPAWTPLADLRKAKEKSYKHFVRGDDQ